MFARPSVDVGLPASTDVVALDVTLVAAAVTPGQAVARSWPGHGRVVCLRTSEPLDDHHRDNGTADLKIGCSAQLNPRSRPRSLESPPLPDDASAMTQTDRDGRPSRQATHRRLIFGDLALAFVGSVIALIGMTVVAINMVRSGRGQETYRTWWLVEYDWNGFLVLIVGSVLALLVGLGVAYLSRRREQREERELFEQYGRKPEGR
jgi:uncharacterized membrane protein